LLLLVKPITLVTHSARPICTHDAQVVSRQSQAAHARQRCRVHAPGTA
jgi:hypothetical protein